MGRCGTAVVDGSASSGGIFVTTRGFATPVGSAAPGTMITARADDEPFVVICVGGFLEIGPKHVAVASASCDVRDETMLLFGLTGRAPKCLPSFSYAG